MKPLPSHVSEVDALRLHNAMLIASEAKLKADLAQSELVRLLREAGKKYRFDPSTDSVTFATREIVRAEKG